MPTIQSATANKRRKVIRKSLDAKSAGRSPSKPAQGETKRSSSEMAGSSAAGQQLAIARAMLVLLRSVHEFLEPDDQRRAFLKGLCQLVGADRGILSLTGIDRKSARHQVHRVVTVNLAQGTTRTQRSSAIQASAAAPSPEITEVSPDTEGPCLDSYHALLGIRRVGCIALFRCSGAKKFTPADRAIVELAHVEFAWIYDKD